MSFFLLVFGAGCGIRFYRFLIIVFLSIWHFFYVHDIRFVILTSNEVHELIARLGVSRESDLRSVPYNRPVSGKIVREKREIT